MNPLEDVMLDNLCTGTQNVLIPSPESEALTLAIFDSVMLNKKNFNQ